jgi:hypothetical protein
MATIQRLDLPGISPAWDVAAVADQVSQRSAGEAGKAALRKVFPTMVETVTRLALDAKDPKVQLAAASKLLDLAVVFRVVPTDPDSLEQFLRDVSERPD